MVVISGNKSSNRRCPRCHELRLRRGMWRSRTKGGTRMRASGGIDWQWWRERHCLQHRRFARGLASAPAPAQVAQPEPEPEPQPQPQPGGNCCQACQVCRSGRNENDTGLDLTDFMEYKNEIRDWMTPAISVRRPGCLRRRAGTANRKQMGSKARSRRIDTCMCSSTYLYPYYIIRGRNSG